MGGRGGECKLTVPSRRQQGMTRRGRIQRLSAKTLQLCVSAAYDKKYTCTEGNWAASAVPPSPLNEVCIAWKTSCCFIKLGYWTDGRLPGFVSTWAALLFLCWLKLIKLNSPQIHITFGKVIKRNQSWETKQCRDFLRSIIRLNFIMKHQIIAFSSYLPICFHIGQS